MVDRCMLPHWQRHYLSWFVSCKLREMLPAGHLGPKPTHLHIDYPFSFLQRPADRMMAIR
jgi:hypothetical protein